MQHLVITLFLSLIIISSFTMAEEPMLPSGLIEPTLPSGLDSDPEDDWDDDDSDWQDAETWQFNGFWEARLGTWRKAQSFLGQYPIAETRMQLSGERAYDNFTLNISADLLYDNMATKQQPDLETGQGWLDLRVANIVFSPLSFMDIRLGRQILTWGTGDLIFINDLFPKDWNSFLIGRDNAYLKAPSDAIKLSMFSNTANLDVVYTPRFDSDRYINGERVSYYNANLGGIAGTNAIVNTDKPEQWVSDGELALRLYRNIATFELALYGYRGYWKSPAGISDNKAIFPRLNVYGASFRGPFFKGIVNGEWGYYDSRDDANGSNALINNSEQRLLLGYEQELIANLTLAFQLYSTQMLDYDNYVKSLPSDASEAKQYRHEVSSRLTWLALNQKLMASLFIRYSPSDNDYYLRPKLRYSMDDHWSYEMGANVFYGKQANTFFGQFEYNDNVYAALRYGL